MPSMNKMSAEPVNLKRGQLTLAEFLLDVFGEVRGVCKGDMFYAFCGLYTHLQSHKSTSGDAEDIKFADAEGVGGIEDRLGLIRYGWARAIRYRLTMAWQVKRDDGAE